jgi:hypothetical protein
MILTKITLDDAMDVLSLHPVMALTVAMLGMLLITGGIVHLYHELNTVAIRDKS